MEKTAFLLDLLKAGGILAGVVVTVGIFVVMFKYVLPVLVAMRPANGSKTDAGPMFILLQQLAGLPSEVKVLSAELKEHAKSIDAHVLTKADVLDEMSKNRHDMANAVSAPFYKLATAVESNTREIRRLVDRRVKPRGTRERRKK